VLDYFEGEYGKRLLVWDLTAEPRWEILCDWLGVPVPEEPFPWENRTKTQQKWIEDAKREDSYEAKLHVNPNLFEKVRAQDIRVGDITAVTNQIITGVVHSPTLDGMKETVKLWSDDKKIIMEPGKLVWIHRRSVEEKNMNPGKVVAMPIQGEDDEPASE
jgi:hypothetical protein